jgi:c-di-GMP phosphodiesterase
MSMDSLAEPLVATPIAPQQARQQDSCIYVARQPIFDRQRQVFAYELLFRDGVGSVFPDVEGDLATRAVLVNTYINIGLEQIAGDHRIFVNFTEETLLSRLPMLFPRDKLVVEILENIQPTTDLIEACNALADHGFVFALDDFEYHPVFEPFIDRASIIKLDFVVTPRDEIESMVHRFRAQGKQLLAEKIETEEEYQYALNLGFSYFQGYFFSRPEVISSTTVQSAKINLLQILAAVAGDFDVDDIEKLMARDVSISYKLLRYINSATHRTVNRISSIRHAILLLGKKEFKNFIALVLAADMASGKPIELTRAALTRAKFCELLARSAQAGDNAEFFLLGLFSLLDAILDQSMAWVTEQLPLSDHLTEALLRRGPLAVYLHLAICYERGDWDEVPLLLQELDVSEDVAMAAYHSAINWTEELMSANS